MMVNKCCNNKESFFVVYDCGNSEEKWLVCKQHMSKESFQKYIKEKREV
jgi:hypothetical protein